ncbi:DNA translocase FtsK [Neobacillus sp. 179-C4.2 HS]|uniref:DNA translocase FtsK n=1 Tax=Neobacillus driksii TaxID=3035913 RepID=A0ABV4YM26_9BACI|nr:DNA translocase FtsK [Neobacillus sp. 179.-C4.2 HS]MDP5196373.1 DNA translocase FtsK [Neobacillus sp. 179.-C4.2 HS]
MSWIQTFFQKFIKDNQDEYAEYDIHTKQMERSLPQKIIEGRYQLDTKISYQYPKGKRHMYVQPEDPTVKSDKTNRQKRVEPRSEVHSPEKRRSSDIRSTDTKSREVINKSQKRVELRSEVHSPEIRRSSDSRSTDTKSREVINKSTPPIKKKPFQLTEVPSPVYGFSRPAKPSENIVEHELSHFLDDGSDKLLVSILETEKEPMPEVEIAASETAVTIAEIEVMEELPVNQPKVEEQAATSSLDVPQDSREVHTRKRSHLPFNVMMLKQDKLKWEERKSRRTLPEQEEKGKGETTELKKKPENIESKEEIQVEPPKVEVFASKPISIQPELKVETVPASNILKEKPIVESDSSSYEFPQMNLLNPPVIVEDDTEWLLYQEELLNQTLQNFNVGASVVNVTQGPAVTRFEVQPEPGVKVNKITNLSDDIKLSLAARDIRIEAPIPGKHTIGIEVPNQRSRPVLINEIIQSPVFRESASPLTAVLGLDISGKPIVTDLKKMPHGLIAGATGSGKSVCINTILVSLLFKASPEDLKLLLIDPKMVELAPYNRIPHLVSPVITDVKAATASLKWAVEEMERRYELFAHSGVRDINRFNELAIKHKQYSDKLPFIVIIIDELADLMMMSPADVEEAICRIAQKARACGIHLIVATQRPSVDVITGLIKANIPTRIAFSVSSQVDSRTIIDISGAEKLLGRGDMLFLENGSSKPVRLQGTFVSDEEIDLVVGHVREQREPDYLFEQEELLKKAQVTEEEDELFYEACEFIIEQGLASTSSLQRRFKIGYNRAARLMDMLESNGFITSANGSKPREVLITVADLESLQDTGTMN